MLKRRENETNKEINKLPCTDMVKSEFFERNCMSQCQQNLSVNCKGISSEEIVILKDNIGACKTFFLRWWSQCFGSARRYCKRKQKGSLS